jgi:hypothetical protein
MPIKLLKTNTILFLVIYIAFLFTATAHAKEVIVALYNTDDAENFKYGDVERFTDALEKITSASLDPSTEIKRISVSRLEVAALAIEKALNPDDRISGIILLGHGVQNQFQLSKTARYSGLRSSQLVAESIKHRQVTSSLAIFFYSCSLGHRGFFHDFVTEFFLDFEMQLSMQNKTSKAIVLAHTNNVAATFAYEKPLPTGGRFFFEWKLFRFVPKIFRSGLGIPAGATLIASSVAMSSGSVGAFVAAGLASFGALMYTTIIASNELRIVQRDAENHIRNSYALSREKLRSTFCESQLSR